MGLLSTVGDYDAILVPLLLQKSRVHALLPPHLQDPNILLPTAAINAMLESENLIPTDKHPVIFVLGHQSNCGPSILPGKMSFQVQFVLRYGPLRTQNQLVDVC